MVIRCGARGSLPGLAEDNVSKHTALAQSFFPPHLLMIVPLAIVMLHIFEYILVILHAILRLSREN
jgi:hypothetical protein